VMGRLREDGGAGPCWITTTPKGRNWVWREFVENRRASYALFHARTQDNPYLAAEFVDDLEQSYTGSWAAQELGGEFVAFEGLVYEQFGADNVAERADYDPQRGIVEIAFDDGFAANPRVFLFLQRDDDGSVCVFDELYHTRHLPNVCIGEAKAMLAQHAERAGVTEPPAYFEIAVGDPSAVELIASFRQADIPARGARLEVIEGIKRVRSWVRDGSGRARLLVHPRCANFIREMSEYSYPAGTEDKSTVKPVKESDHGPDAIRYWLWLRTRAAA
jgi:phage terminase large subunit